MKIYSQKRRIVLKNIKRIKDILIKNSINFTENEPLFEHNSIKIGGKAKIFALPDNLDQFVFLLNLAEKNKTKYQILGKGTNTLFCDNGFDGIVICTKNLKSYQIFDDGIFAECGLGLFDLGNICAKNSLSGIEFCYGIPGSVGGAMVTNSGAFENQIGNFVEFVKIYENGKIYKLSQSDMKFSYRSSILENTKKVVLGTKFKLEKKEKDQIENLQKNYFSKKVQTQPYGKLSLGSVFKRNLDFPPVSKLIDELGLKGYKIGDAMVSTKHAGFLINYANATCKDFLLLVQYIQQKIFESYGFVPELEIKIAGDIDASFWRLSHTYKIQPTSSRQKHD